mgnify:CR=1 FL=1
MGQPVNWDHVKTWSPLALAVLLLGASAVALERDNLDGAAGLASVSFLLVGVWLAVLLHDRWHDGHGDR